MALLAILNGCFFTIRDLGHGHIRGSGVSKNEPRRSCKPSWQPCVGQNGRPAWGRSCKPVLGRHCKPPWALRLGPGGLLESKPPWEQQLALAWPPVKSCDSLC